MEYFLNSGGEVIKYHKDKWFEASKNGSECILCKNNCHCQSVEMILYFS